MSKRILIFRTDRVGDLIVSCPAILAIKKHFIDCNITLIASVKNFEYAKSLNIFSEVIIFPQENLIKKIKFISNLSKINFDYIFIFDGKDRSFLTSFFIKSRVKTGLATNIKKYHDFLKIKIFEFNNDNKLFDAMENLLIYSGITTKISDFSFISRKKDNNFSNNISINESILSSRQ